MHGGITHCKQDFGSVNILESLGYSRGKWHRFNFYYFETQLLVLQEFIFEIYLLYFVNVNIVLFLVIPRL